MYTSLHAHAHADAHTHAHARARARTHARTHAHTHTHTHTQCTTSVLTQPCSTTEQNTPFGDCDTSLDLSEEGEGLNLFCNSEYVLCHKHILVIQWS